tara:strand:- start:41 stop:547 length:507 start_codon:yes stop_codon:yes gene_type:complete
MQKSKRKNSLLYLFLIGILLNSCSLETRLERKQRRAERKIEKLTIMYPDLLKRDTVKDTFNIITSSIKHDTSFIDTTSDTTYIYKDKLRIKYVRVGDTTYIEGECKGDTIIRTVEIPVETIVVRKQSIVEQLGKNVKRIIAGITFLIIVAIAIAALFKILKKSIWPLG